MRGPATRPAGERRVHQPRQHRSSDDDREQDGVHRQDRDQGHQCIPCRDSTSCKTSIHACDPADFGAELLVAACACQDSIAPDWSPTSGTGTHGPQLASATLYLSVPQPVTVANLLSGFGSSSLCGNQPRTADASPRPYPYAPTDETTRLRYWLWPDRTFDERVFYHDHPALSVPCG